MPIDVLLYYHFDKALSLAARNDIEAITDSLRGAFATIRINLILTKADSEIDCPTESTIANLITRLKLIGSECGHLAFLDAESFSNGNDSPGVMIDCSYRSLSLISFRNSYFSKGTTPAEKQDRLVQTCIHEIGHMLNLPHDKKTGYPYTAAMHPSDIRELNVTTPMQSWKKAISASNVSPPALAAIRSVCFPFSEESTKKIKRLMSNYPEDITPGKGPFHYPCH